MASSSRALAPPGMSSARASTPSMRCWYSGTRDVRKPGSAVRKASAFVVVIFIVGKWLDRFFAVARQQDFHLLLRGAQGSLALARERNATFESLERFLERHVALLEFRDQRLELGQRLL